MNIKRVLTTVIGLPIVVAVILVSNTYIIDAILTIVALIGMHEYIKCCSSKDAKIIKWVSYISTFIIAIAHVVPAALLTKLLIISIPILLMILFLHVIVTDQKVTYTDVAYTLLGILYVTGSILFVSLTYGIMKDGVQMGKVYIWYIMLAAWGTDIFAYLVGKHFGKHKFSSVSPNKTIEGCIAGTLSAAIVCLIYTYCINTFLGHEINMIMIGIVSIILSIAGQIGDFAASVIKRNFDVKDYSNLFPGHGGMLDRIDSLMFIAPVTFAIFGLFLI